LSASIANERAVRKRYRLASIASSIGSIAFGQGVVSVDLLEPWETTGTIPANTRIVDIYVDIASTDSWTTTGIRALTENGATINYWDSDPTTPGIQPGLYNGGAANKFLTSLSRPRPRDGGGRFNNAGVEVAGAYDPPESTPTTTPNELNVEYFASPPETADSPSVDGYIARISVDISATGLPDNYNGGWQVSRVGDIFPGASVVLRSLPINAAVGTMSTTFDAPDPTGLNWALWWIPEPSSAALLVLGGLVIVRRRES
jgi:hypothetical protein